MTFSLLISMAVAALAGVGGQQTKYCPVLECVGREATIGASNYTCYEWVSNQPLRSLKVRVRECEWADQVCDIFSLNQQAAMNLDNKASVYASLDPLDSLPSLAAQRASQWCTFQEAVWTNLHVGSKCLFSRQCLTFNCLDGRCAGRSEGAEC
mmetsp:Transcript_14223/g.24194  ORF Transcript_14223/g.24194 Transcript_14223/m.24194 type:complete len:153 (+) Transcript_14223:3-461(+)